MRWALGKSALRIHTAWILMAIMMSVFGGRLIQLQAFDTGGDAAAAAAKLQTTVTLLPQRGIIVDANGRPLASSEEAFAITVDPTMTNPMKDGVPTKANKVNEIAEIFARHLGGVAADYLPALTKENTRFAYVAKKVPAATYNLIITEVREIGGVGVFREADPIRTYPNGGLAANIIGFTGYDGKGLAGLEYSLNASLTGTPGQQVYDRAPNGNTIPLGANVITPATNGVNYQLTIDSDVQFMAEQALAAQVKKVNAASGIAVVINIKTGEVVAMATAPSYDPNNPAKGTPANMGNRAVQMAYEPGSVQKILTLAAVIDDGKADPNTRVVVPPYIAGPDYRVKDVWDHGTIQLTTTGIAAMSSNIGTIRLSREISVERLHQRLTDFGLGRPTGIELPGEASGRLPAATMADWQRDQIAFGQGLSVTAIQEAAAIAGILNGGMYNQPTVIKSATAADGATVAVNRQPSRRIVSEQTSAMMTQMLEGIMYDQAHIAALGLESYRSGGKTGTAQRYNDSCGCYQGRTTSYVGYAPVEDPQLLTYVVLDDTKNGNSGMATAGPVYQDIMNFALPLFGVMPSTTKPQAGALTW